MKRKPIVYVLIPVHNRKATTLSCLENLQCNGDLDRYHVVVIDDGSTDGTTNAIKSQFPTVATLQGDGRLWWAGSIVKGMKYAHERGAEFIIWLNDDTFPQSDALSKLVIGCAAATRQILTAQCYTDETLSIPSYGGRLVGYCDLKIVVAKIGECLTSDVCSGNLVCMPRSLIDTIGYPPSLQTPQAWSDVVYTWWAKCAGFDLKVCGDAVAICANNPIEEGWSSSSIPMRTRWQQLCSPKSSIYPPAYWFYCYQLYGLNGIILFSTVYLKLILFTVFRAFIPLPWIFKLKRILLT